MYNSIKSELRHYKVIKFTGHIKFGIENGKVVSETVSTKLEPSPGLTDSNFDAALQSIADDKFYGSIDYNLNRGIIESMNYVRSWQGETLRAKIEGNKCKNVYVVAKK